MDKKDKRKYICTKLKVIVLGHTRGIDGIIVMKAKVTDYYREHVKICSVSYKAMMNGFILQIPGITAHCNEIYGKTNSGNKGIIKL